MCECVADLQMNISYTHTQNRLQEGTNGLLRDVNQTLIIKDNICVSIKKGNGRGQRGGEPNSTGKGNVSERKELMDKKDRQSRDDRMRCGIRVSVEVDRKDKEPARSAWGVPVVVVVERSFSLYAQFSGNL